jgi:hypothetical protein
VVVSSQIVPVFPTHSHFFIKPNRSACATNGVGADCFVEVRD